MSLPRLALERVFLSIIPVTRVMASPHPTRGLLDMPANLVSTQPSPRGVEYALDVVSQLLLIHAVERIERLLDIVHAAQLDGWR
jgi:hypothetical protein